MYLFLNLLAEYVLPLFCCKARKTRKALCLWLQTSSILELDPH